jgi:pimeloyl-ACP methyl ester carboxylesterase
LQVIALKLLSIIFALMATYPTLADPITIYCFPGQGSDRRLFDSLSISPGYQIKVIEYGTPEAGMSMTEFARELSRQIDTSKPFVLVGVSLGGMICAELNEILHPHKTILISSAKNRGDLPRRYRFQSKVPFYKLFPGSVLLVGARVLQPIVEPDRKSHKETFESMLGSKDPIYMERTIAMIMNWDRLSNSGKIYHIHGTSDRTLPFGKIKAPTHVVEKGSHMMTLTKAKEVSQILNSILAL